MAFNYTRSQFLLDVNAGIRGKISMIASQENFANRVMRDVIADVALRSTRRKLTLAPDLFPEIQQYACPSDLYDGRIIDIPAQAKRHDGAFGMVPVQQFNVGTIDGDIAIDDYNGIRTLLVDSAVTAAHATLSPLESITSGGGNWTAIGDATNIRTDGDDYVKGNGSVAMDIGAGATTTAGIENVALNTFDITEFLNGRSAVFVWAFISSTTDIVSYSLRLGSSNANYYTKTVTTRHDGNPFQRGWNLLRFPLTTLTETGTVVDTAIDYAAIIMNKNVGKVNEQNFKFNWLVVMEGVIHDILYYSKYGWVDNTGTYLENSTSGDDLLVADTSEYNLILAKGIAIAMRLTNFPREEVVDADNMYKQAMNVYGGNNPDESQITVSTYHRYSN